MLEFVSILLLTFEKENKQKVVLRFASILVLIFEKGNKQKNCARYFEIRKYAF